MPSLQAMGPSAPWLQGRSSREQELEFLAEDLPVLDPDGLTVKSFRAVLLAEQDVVAGRYVLDDEAAVVTGRGLLDQCLLGLLGVGIEQEDLQPGLGDRALDDVAFDGPGLRGCVLGRDLGRRGAGLSFTVTVSLESPTRPTPLVARAVTTILPLESLGTASCAFQMRSSSSLIFLPRVVLLSAAALAKSASLVSLPATTKATSEIPEACGVTVHETSIVRVPSSISPGDFELGDLRSEIVQHDHGG